MKINRSASLAGSLSQDDEGKKSENNRTSDTSRRKLQKRKLGLSGTLVCVTWVGPRVRSRILYPTLRRQMRISGVYIPIKPSQP
jgi:hypothetical protein